MEKPEKDTPRGGTSVRTATEVQKPMNNTKWIYWEGRLEREWPGEKGVRERTG